MCSRLTQCLCPCHACVLLYKCIQNVSGLFYANLASKLLNLAAKKLKALATVPLTLKRLKALATVPLKLNIAQLLKRAKRSDAPTMQLCKVWRHPIQSEWAEALKLHRPPPCGRAVIATQCWLYGIVHCTRETLQVNNIFCPEVGTFTLDSQMSH